MKLQALLFFLGLTGGTVMAQLPRNTDIWAFTMDYNNSSKTYKAGVGINISNNAGYDNQPMFSPAGDYLLYSSDRGKGQTDIYRYDFFNGKNEPFKETAVSEYSPTFVPGSKYVSSVVVEADSSQHLWQYHKASKDAKRLLEKVDKIGYHTWLDERTVFLFILGEPFTLLMADIKTGQTKRVAGKIGRSMTPYRDAKRKMLLFTQADTSDKYVIRATNTSGVVDKEFKPIPMLEGCQDFTADNFGNLLMAKGSKLYAWRIDESTAWREVADFSHAGIKNITRICISKTGNRIAVVENTGE
jgi:hypothetical protein